jgi:dihydroorotate dehydrogenase
LCFDKDAVSELFMRLDDSIQKTPAVILWKVSNGMPRSELLHNIHEVAKCKSLSGIITGNTVPDAYDVLPDGRPAIQTDNGLVRGGMGGPAVFPLALSATDLAAPVLAKANKIVVSTGGVTSSAEVRSFIKRGAFMTQVNSAFREASEDPSFITDIAQDLLLSE